MPTLPIWLAIIAALFFGPAEHPALFWLSLVAALVGFVSYAIMRHAATVAAARRREVLLWQMKQEGKSEVDVATVESLPIQLTLSDTQAAPNWATVVNMAATLISAVLFVWGIVVRVT